MADDSNDDNDGGGEVVARGRKPHSGKNKKRPQPNPKAKDLLEGYQKCVKSLRSEVGNYWINYAFLQGSQWVYWDDSANRMSELPRDPDRVRITNNRMAANTRTVMAKAMQRHLVFEVMPSSSDDASIRGARLGENILRQVHRAHDWEVVRERLLQATWKGGTAAICVNWDPDTNDVIIPASNDGEPAVHEGDTFEEVLSIAEFAVEPGSRDPERARYWYKAVTSPPKQVQAQFSLDWEPDADGFSAQAPYVNRFSTTVSRATNRLRRSLVGNGHLLSWTIWSFTTTQTLPSLHRKLGRS